ncbi:hypothetical protein [Streptomyces sp. ISL-1]|uniref:hypothetical protein n=1 Tax=Streptomyces sp. ISL-1 TaxID=2817657 RepID=UPI0035AC19DA
MTVDQHMVFVDNNRSAWQRNRQRKGGMPYCRTVLQIAYDNSINLHGQANQRDLADPTTGSSCASR